ncbi:Mpm1p SCDLUD_003549 [Saccharomycodes ludwigii]|uniref:Mpm1p n=1 Tax=Saccharomycodes ludwigii TaxID=36035 RepID=UPI001E86E785|nr:hypothetical protein SCDLUD_003549 [Saccharomycodes ludwigii]KAH3900558.1 hypothetical protein SCDLUD_003549 [Saccharomycodes ludwigii]
MGLFNGDNQEKNVTKYNETLLGDTSSISNNSSAKPISTNLLSDWWSQTQDLYSNVFNQPDQFWKSAYDDLLLRSGDAIGTMLENLGMPGNFGTPYKMSSLFNNDEQFVDANVDEKNKLKIRPTLYAYKTPSDRQYSQCVTNAGLGVWDVNGFWRCLFPQTFLNDKKVNELSKDDVEKDIDHKMGLFFKDYTGFLSWRNHMLKLANEKKKQIQQKSLFFTDNYDGGQNDDIAGNGGNVIGTSKMLNYNYTDEGKEQVKETKTYYNDGKVKVVRERKLYPKDGSGDVKVETSEKILDNNDIDINE